MKLFKSYAVLIISVVAIQGSLLIIQSFTTPKSGDGYHERFIKKGEVASPEEWFDILIGKWSYSLEKRGPEKFHILNGTIQYFLDSTTVKKLNYKLYENSSRKEDPQESDYKLQWQLGWFSKTEFDIKVKGDAENVFWSDGFDINCHFTIAKDPEYNGLESIQRMACRENSRRSVCRLEMF